MIDTVVLFSELGFYYDPTGSRKKNYDSLNKKHLFLHLSDFLKEKKSTGYKYRIFGQYFIKESSDVILCLDNSECSTFSVSILERGRLRSAAVHISIVSALADFLFRALDEKPFYYLDIDPMIRYNDVEEQNS